MASSALAIQPLGNMGFRLLIIERRKKRKKKGKEKERKGKGREGKGKDASLIGAFVQLELGKETRSDCPPFHCSESSHRRCQFSIVLTPCLFKGSFMSYERAIIQDHVFCRLRASSTIAIRIVEAWDFHPVQEGSEADALTPNQCGYCGCQFGVDV
jgi:hypothetical protein